VCGLFQGHQLILVVFQLAVEHRAVGGKLLRAVSPVGVSFQFDVIAEVFLDLTFFVWNIDSLELDLLRQISVGCFVHIFKIL